MNKADDFGHHCNRYYQLEVSYYMSTMDTKLLKYFWNSYWVQTLSGNKLGGISSYLNSQLSNLDSILQGVSIVFLLAANVYVVFRSIKIKQRTNEVVLFLANVVMILVNLLLKQRMAYFKNSSSVLSAMAHHLKILSLVMSLNLLKTPNFSVTLLILVDLFNFLHMFYMLRFQ